MKKQLGLAALGLAGLTAGAGAGLVLTGGSGDAVAQTPTTSPDTTAPTDSTTDSTTDPTAPADDARSTWLQEALAPLVEDGTITQAQADAVVGALQEARPDRGAGRGGPGHGGFGRGGGRFGFDAAAEALGISAEELRTQLQDGTTIAEVAEAEGVDIATVKTAMLEAFRTHEQEHVTSGRLTQAQADANIAAFEGRLDELVTTTFPRRPGKDDSAPTTTG